MKISKNATLVSYNLDTETGTMEMIYRLRHNSLKRRTVLEQDLHVKKTTAGEFIPTLELSDFPKGLSDRESMLKLADWLQRLGSAIEDTWGTP